MTVTADDIAALVQRHYDELPPKRKPVVRGNGLREWVPLAGIVAQGENDELWCLSLATGMKCLPVSRIPEAQGNVLHDWHAEVLAIRAFNRFVLDECRTLALGGSSKFLRRRTCEEMASSSHINAEEEHGRRSGWQGQPFAWREGVLLHMYCSEAPCGDASMELIMASQEDATPWELPTETLPNSSGASASASASNPTISPTPISPISIPTTTPSLPGRAYFSHLGVVRRKPARADAIPTLSKSCSDKLSLHQITSLLSSTTALLVDPSRVYLRTLILPESRYSESACRRAFSSSPGARMSSLANSSFGGGYAFHPFAVSTTSSEFAYSQRSVASALSQLNSYDTAAGTPPTAAAGMAPSNLAVAWTSSGLAESTLGGVLQGRKSPAGAKGASFASRRGLWSLATSVASLLSNSEVSEGLAGRGEGNGELEATTEKSAEIIEEIQKALSARTYGEMKASMLLGARRRAKEEAKAEALKGWVRNQGDDSFTL
ncbi:adenosine deaminase/editase [Hypoxylon sp. FL0543]|nr:adenosine deaminase/editase [Hypoxylon sp. FL0543]